MSFKDKLKSLGNKFTLTQGIVAGGLVIILIGLIFGTIGFAKVTSTERKTSANGGNAKELFYQQSIEAGNYLTGIKNYETLGPVSQTATSIYFREDPVTITENDKEVKYTNTKENRSEVKWGIDKVNGHAEIFYQEKGTTTKTDYAWDEEAGKTVATTTVEATRKTIAFTEVNGHYVQVFEDITYGGEGEEDVIQTTYFEFETKEEYEESLFDKFQSSLLVYVYSDIAPYTEMEMVMYPSMVYTNVDGVVSRNIKIKKVCEYNYAQSFTDNLIEIETKCKDNRFIGGSSATKTGRDDGGVFTTHVDLSMSYDSVDMVKVDVSKAEETNYVVSFNEVCSPVLIYSFYC